MKLIRLDVKLQSLEKTSKYDFFSGVKRLKFRRTVFSFFFFLLCECSLTLLVLGEVGQAKKHYEGFHNWYQFYRLQTASELSDVQVASVTYDTEVSYYLVDLLLDLRTTLDLGFSTLANI